MSFQVSNKLAQVPAVVSAMTGLGVFLDWNKKKIIAVGVNDPAVKHVLCMAYGHGWRMLL